MSAQDVRGTLSEIQQRVDRIGSEARQLGSDLQSTVGDVEEYLRREVAQHPLRTLGIAAGVGYILGGGLQSRFTALLFALGSRVAVEYAARQVSSRLAPDGDAEGRPQS
jgi:hypothetical protein